MGEKTVQSAGHLRLLRLSLTVSLGKLFLYIVELTVEVAVKDGQSSPTISVAVAN